MPFRPRVLSLLAVLGALSVPHLHAQSCTYGNINHTAPEVWKHQYCAPPTFTTVPLTFASAGTYPAQYLGKLQGGRLNSTASVTAALVGASSGVTLANLSLSSTPPPTAAQGDTGLYIYGDINIARTAAPGTLGLVMSLVEEGVQVLSAVDALMVRSASAATCQQDVTSKLQITSTQPVRLFNTQLYTQIVTLKNISGSNLNGPVLLGLTNLSANAQLFAGNGALPCGANAGTPYQLAANGLASGASVRVVLTFTNSLVPQANVAYQTVVLAGS